MRGFTVLLLGGFESIAGAIVGGLIAGAYEKLEEVYIGTLVGGGIESWFPYALALAFLLVRPTGLFGERAVERVWASTPLPGLLPSARASHRVRSSDSLRCSRSRYCSSCCRSWSTTTCSPRSWSPGWSS